MDHDAVLPPQVVQLFRDLGGVLDDARTRLDALLARAQAPPEGDLPPTCARLAPPTAGSR